MTKRRLNSLNDSYLPKFYFITYHFSNNKKLEREQVSFSMVYKHRNLSYSTHNLMLIYNKFEA